MRISPANLALVATLGSALLVVGGATDSIPSLRRASESETTQEIFKGTRVTDSNEIPAFALLCFTSGGEESCIGCGGVLITSTHVLTAAHCQFKNNGNKNDKATAVRIGALTKNGGTYRTVSKVVNHPDYDYDTDLNDLAILTLSAPVTGVTPIPFNRNRAYPDGTSKVSVTAYGYGGINKAGDTSDFLRKASTKIVADSVCSNEFGGQYKVNRQVCSKVSDEGICAGDSGGPLVDANGVVMAVLSYGTSACEDATIDVWADPAAYADWIDEEAPQPVESDSGCAERVKSLWNRAVGVFSGP